jgi:hypothetical protein
MKNKIYPIFYKGKTYQESDVNDVLELFIIQSTLWIVECQFMSQKGLE